LDVVRIEALGKGPAGNATDFPIWSKLSDEQRSSELILQISITAAALIWNQVAVLHDEQGTDCLAEPVLAQMRRRLTDHLYILAETVERKTSSPAEHLGSLVDSHLLENEHYGEYAKNTIARYEDLRTLASQLAREI